MTTATLFIGPPAGGGADCNARTFSTSGTIFGSATSLHLPARPPFGGFVGRLVTPVLFAVALSLPAALLAQPAVPTPAKAPTDLDTFMAQALQRRDIDRKTLSDYVLDEVEEFEVLGAGKVPFARMRREYTWYVRDGIHVRSPIKFDGVPIPEADRRAYE